MQNKYLYHITDKTTAEKILKEKTLKPIFGEQSQKTYDDRLGVYLCTHKDIPYWKELLGKQTVIRIPTDDLSAYDLEKIQYSGYSEYICKTEIHSENMKQIYTKKPTAEINRNLCELYLYNIHNITRSILDHDHQNLYGTETENLTNVMKSELYILSHLDYQALTKKDWKEINEETVDSCVCACSDYYNMTDKRLYQLLKNNGISEYEKAKQQFYEWMIQNIKPALTAKTGGWNF